jgi:hypothetical protein
LLFALCDRLLSCLAIDLFEVPLHERLHGVGVHELVLEGVKDEVLERSARNTAPVFACAMSACGTTGQIRAPHGGKRSAANSARYITVNGLWSGFGFDDLIKRVAMGALEMDCRGSDHDMFRP